MKHHWDIKILSICTLFDADVKFSKIVVMFVFCRELQLQPAISFYIHVAMGRVCQFTMSVMGATTVGITQMKTTIGAPVSTDPCCKLPITRDILVY